jgi:hypothetical protein
MVFDIYLEQTLYFLQALLLRHAGIMVLHYWLGLNPSRDHGISDIGSGEPQHNYALAVIPIVCRKPYYLQNVIIFYNQFNVAGHFKFHVDYCLLLIELQSTRVMHGA